MIKTIFFDMDGVLLDSMQAHITSWKQAFSETGFRVSEEDLRKRGGLSFTETILEIAKLNGKKSLTQDEIDKIFSRKKEFMSKQDSFISSFPIQKEIEKIKKKGIQLYVVSGSFKKTVTDFINKFFPNLFDSIISRDDTNKGKPNPDPYLKALKESGFDASECIVVEDSPLGIESAKKARIKVFALETSLDKSFLQEADKIFENHDQLFDYITSNIL